MPRTPHDRHRKVHPFRLLLLIVCATVFVACAWLLSDYFIQIGRTKAGTEELRALYRQGQDGGPEPSVSFEPVFTPRQTTAAPEASPVPYGAASADAEGPAAAITPDGAAALWPAAYPNNPKLQVSSQFSELLKQNRDVVGWLTIDGLLDEPVVQRDNEYYLTHDYLKKKSVTGALFLDEACDLRSVPAQLLIHGHNMKEGAMFGALKKYKVKSAAFYREHPYISFHTLYEDAEYVIFAVAEVSVDPDNARYFPFWYYPTFSTEAEFSHFLGQARGFSHYRCGVDVRPGDRLLTLSTCSGTDESLRLLVMARMLRDDEDSIALHAAILSTSDK